MDTDIQPDVIQRHLAINIDEGKFHKFTLERDDRFATMTFKLDGETLIEISHNSKWDKPEIRIHPTDSVILSYDVSPK